MTPKRTFSHSDSFNSAIIDLSLLCFKRSFVIYLYCQLIYCVMETNYLTLKYISPIYSNAKNFILWIFFFFLYIFFSLDLKQYRKICNPCGVVCWIMLLPQFMGAHYWKANEVNDVKRRWQKNIQNKPIQTKINLYINKYIKRKHYKTLRIF